MAVSGGCALLVGFVVGNQTMLTAVCLLWGFAIVADSAQFSAAISELCQQEYTGTALTLQTSLGFLLTLVPIRLVPMVGDWLGWRWAFAFLAIGPLLGILSMRMLRRSADSLKMAGGRK
jgi:MFS family permease